MWCPPRVHNATPFIYIYVNDMSDVINDQLLLCADDSAILVADKLKSNIEKLFKKELETVSGWLIDNKLSLHLGKTA